MAHSNIQPLTSLLAYDLDGVNKWVNLIMADGVLHQSLAQAVSDSRTQPDAVGWQLAEQSLNEWKIFLEDEQDNYRNEIAALNAQLERATKREEVVRLKAELRRWQFPAQWEIARQLFRTAHYVAHGNYEAMLQNDDSELTKAATELVFLKNMRPANLVIWLKSFLAGGAAEHEVKVPFAVVTGQEGRVFYLKVTRVAKAFSHVGYHPQGYFGWRKRIDEDFTNSIAMAGNLALKVFEEESKAESGDLDFRSEYGLSYEIVETDAAGREVVLQTPLEGRSASGAAARAFYYALKGWYPDEEVAVIGQVKETESKAIGAATEIAGFESGEEMAAITVKAKAIEAFGKLDTIVVVSEENRQAAEAGLSQRAKAAQAIRVCCLAAA